MAADLVDDTVAEQRNECQVARFGVVEMSCDAVQVDRVALCVEKASAAKIVDAEPDVVQELLSTDVGDESDVGQTEYTPDGVARNRGVVGSLKKVEQTEDHSRG